MSNWVSTDSIKAYFFWIIPPKCQGTGHSEFSQRVTISYLSFWRSKWCYSLLSSNFLNKCPQMPRQQRSDRDLEVMSRLLQNNHRIISVKRPEWKWHKITAPHKWASSKCSCIHSKQIYCGFICAWHRK